MTGDDGFERKLSNFLNEELDEIYSYRRKQHRFSSQDIDLLVDSTSGIYKAIECKSKQIDVEKAGKENNSSEAKLYFNQGFSVNQDGEHQIPRITEFLQKTGREGFLAVAYRRGRGRKVHWYCIDWIYVREKYREEDCSGLTREYIKENGWRLDEEPEKILKKLKARTE